MSDLETRLLEFWKASAKEWRRRNNLHEQAESQEDTMSSRDVERKSPVLVPKICAHCGNEFLAGRHDRKFCSIPCTRRAADKRANERERQRRIKLGLRVRPIRKRGPRGVWQSVEIADTARTGDGFRCVVCRKPFAPNTRPGESEPRRPPLYCSATCNQRAHRNRRANG